MAQRMGRSLPRFIRRAGQAVAVAGLLLVPLGGPVLAQGLPGAASAPGSSPGGAALPGSPALIGATPALPGLPSGAAPAADEQSNPLGPSAPALRDLGTGNPLEQLRRQLSSKAARDEGTTSRDEGKDRAPVRDVGPTGFTEFQQYVYEITGRVLPRFGAGLFSGSFHSLQNVPVPADYVLGPGDEIQVRMWGIIDAEFRLVIDREGLVSIPKVGTFSLLGVKAGDLEAALREQIGKSFSNFHLSATMGQLRSMQVYVVGQANRPGMLTVSSLSTLVSTLFESGGPNANGSMRRIELQREGRVLGTIDLYDFISRGDKSRDQHLLPGDVIVIPPVGPQVALLGPVDSPAIYELAPDGEAVREVLARGGGPTVMSSPLKAQLERLDPSDPRAPRLVQSLLLDPQGMATPLRDGDVLTMFKLGPAFSNAVTLRGNVAAPLRYPYQPGMKLSDLIPDRDALLTPDYFVRKNVLVEFESGRSTQGGVRVQNEVHDLVDELNWDYAVIERLDHDRLTTQLIPFDLGRLVLRKDPGADLPLMPGDVVTVFSVDDIRVPRAKRSINVRVEGEVQRPGVYPMHAGDSLSTLIDAAGGLTPDAYLYGSEFTREAARRSQQQQMEKTIAKLQALTLAGLQQRSQSASLEGDAALLAARQQIEMTAAQQRLAELRRLKATGRVSLGLTPEGATLAGLPGIPLEDADNLYVPPRPAFIQVLGAVNVEAALIWRKDHTVGDYLQQAGLARFADKDAIFVIRADGGVSDGDSRRWGGVSSLPVQPGDTIVVPETEDKATTYDRVIRSLKDIAIIFQGFGVGAAAFKVLGL